MAFKIKGSHIIAVLITAGIGAWMYNGELNIGGQSGGQASSVPTISERSVEDNDKLFRVSYVPLIAEKRAEAIPVRGRTRANAIITIRSEISGILEKRHVSKGQFIKEGDLLCTIETGARKASVASAKAQLAQAEGEYDSNKELAKKGFASQTKMRQMQFEVDSAKSQVLQAELELNRTLIRANASGIVQDPIAEVGDVMSAGTACVTLVNRDPMLFVGQVSERSINKVEIGMQAEVNLVTGQATSGKISYIAPSADAQTRTFLVEINLDDISREIRDGLSASAEIKLPPIDAFKISPSWLTLSDTGEVGIKTVDEENKVAFQPVKILAQTNQGFWIDGPQAGERIITLGQEYVISGEEVDPVPDEFLKAKVQQ